MFHRRLRSTRIAYQDCATDKRTPMELYAMEFGIIQTGLKGIFGANDIQYVSICTSSFML